VTESLFDRLERYEGYRRYAYKDHLGHLTIGYGTMIEKPGQGVSRSAAKFMMKERVDEIYGALSVFDWFCELDDLRQECMVEMAYQMGINGLLGFRRMIAALKDGDYELAAEEALDSLWAEQTPERAGEVSDRIAGITD